MHNFCQGKSYQFLRAVLSTNVATPNCVAAFGFTWFLGALYFTAFVHALGFLRTYLGYGFLRHGLTFTQGPRARALAQRPHRVASKFASQLRSNARSNGATPVGQQGGNHSSQEVDGMPAIPHNQLPPCTPPYHTRKQTRWRLAHTSRVRGHLLAQRPFFFCGTPAGPIHHRVIEEFK